MIRSTLRSTLGSAIRSTLAPASFVGSDPLPPAYTPPTVSGGVEYDVLRDDGRMWRVHEFKTSGVLSVTDLGDDPMARFMFVGGGASSGSTNSTAEAPGGGAGGSVLEIVAELPEGDLPIIIGAGGPSVSGSSNGLAGSHTFIASGGGFGGEAGFGGGSMPGGNGGGAGSPGTTGPGGGLSGGDGLHHGGSSSEISDPIERSSGGGAGAGGPGGDSVPSVGGDAGYGVQSDISGELEWYGAGAPGMAVSGTHGAPAPGGVTAPEIGAAGDPGTDGRGNAGAPAMDNASGRGGDGIVYFSYPLEALP